MNSRQRAETKIHVPPASFTVPLRTVAALGAALVAIAVLVYLPVRGYGFVNLDDPSYLADNLVVQAGLTWRGVTWAFTTFHLGNWHPITWLSLMLDVTLVGVAPGVHHLVNVALHATNTVVLLAVLAMATGQLWRSALVAALFAVHPLHVESVAWISERKDLLAALFGLLAIGGWVRHVRRPSTGRLAMVALAQALSLACKPMLVTLPLILLLVDRWPLARNTPFTTRVREKWPLLLLSAASCVVTIVSQRAGGSISSLSSIPFWARAENALLALISYLVKTVWPSSLAVVYPHPALSQVGISTVEVAFAAAALAALSGLAAWQWRPRPSLGVGWMWYLVMLLPVIGLVQAGSQAMADRYTYLPLVGIFIAVAWLLPEPRRAPATWVAAACAIAVLAMAARVQVTAWSDSVTLFQRTLAVTKENPTALRNLGMAYVERGRFDLGISALQDSLRLLPGDGFAWMDLGIALDSVGDVRGASHAFRESARLRPNNKTVVYNLAVFAATHGDLATARTQQARLRELSPELARDLERRMGGL
jgi:hypothetical protein